MCYLKKKRVILYMIMVNQLIGLFYMINLVVLVHVFLWLKIHIYINLVCSNMLLKKNNVECLVLSHINPDMVYLISGGKLEEYIWDGKRRKIEIQLGHV
jgi:hypothetical protein